VLDLEKTYVPIGGGILNSLDGKSSIKFKPEEGFEGLFTALLRTVERIREACERIASLRQGRFPEPAIESFRINLKHKRAEWKVRSFTDQDLTYEVFISADGTFSCTCPDHQHRKRACKHVLSLAKVISTWSRLVNSQPSNQVEEIFVPKAPRHIYVGEWYSTPPYIEMEGYSNIRAVVEGVKVGLEFEIPNLPLEDEERRYIRYLLERYPLKYERDGSVGGGELKAKRPLEVKEAIRLLYELKRFREFFPNLFISSSFSGLHIHFNIADLREEKKVLLKELLFKVAVRLQRRKDLLRSIYGRSFNQYTKAYPVGKSFNEISSRYYWINLTNSRTVEFRLGSSKAHGAKYVPMFLFSLNIFRLARNLVLSKDEIDQKDIDLLVKKVLSFNLQAR